MEKDALPPAAADRIRAALLQIHSRQLEGAMKGAKLDAVLREAFDAYARELLPSGKLESDEMLNCRIPGWVFGAAVQFGWLPYPPRIQVRRERAKLDSFWPGAKQIWWEDVPVPEADLVESLGGYKVNDHYMSLVGRLLAGRIAFWKGETLRRRAESGQPPDTPNQIEQAPSLVCANKSAAPESSGTARLPAPGPAGAMDDIRLPPGPARYLQALADLSEERHAEVEQADIAERARLAPDAAQEAGTFLEESGLITRRVGDLTGRSTILARPTLARLSTLKAGVGASQSQVPSEHAPTPGAELKRLRERLCWTQFELAARVNLHESSVARHERDEVIISGQNARAYAECFSRELEEQIRPAMFRPQESQKSP